ncbi:hypothetical protein HDU92_001705 [Lobulomyces angularis]|nr:hypothetical protein HDU92_001705 [Lobulomyces angularis]
MTVSVGKKAPNFKATALVDNEFKTLSLDDYKGKYLVLFFYPLDFTFVCPTEIIAFSDRFPEFQALQTSVVGVSVDSEYAHLAWTNQPRKEGGLGAMKIPLLSDLTKKIALDYGVLNDDGVAFRGTFIIDPEQNVRVAMINDLPIGRSVDEVLRLVEAVQFNEKYGEVCPAGWTKGADTIDTKDAKKYFSKMKFLLYTVLLTSIVNSLPTGTVTGSEKLTKREPDFAKRFAPIPLHLLEKRLADGKLPPHLLKRLSFGQFTPHHEKRTLAEKAVKLNKREVVKRDAEVNWNPQTFLPGPPPLPPLAPKLENPCANANRLHPQCDF